MNPSVCGIMLTADRPAMTARAIRCFEAQTYEPKVLLVLDSGRKKLNLRSTEKLKYATVDPGPSHGELCNIANGMTEGVDILAHFDSDDWSHPRRLDENVLSLSTERTERTFAAVPIRPECVGYNDMLFWDALTERAWFYSHHGKRYTVGASQCYWREAWKRELFKPLVTGADNEWQYRVRMRGASVGTQEPRMICEIHGGNISSRIVRESQQWKRAPEWDEYCRERMEL